MLRFSFASALLALFSCLLAPVGPEDPPVVGGWPVQRVLPRDKIPAIRQPVFVSGREADFQMEDDEPVLGVVGPGGTAKAYSLRQLDRHEIVDDEIDGVAIAATW